MTSTGYIASDGIYTESLSAEKGKRVFPAVREYGERYNGANLANDDMRDVETGDLAYEVLTDFMTDLLHLAHSAGVDVDHLISSAMNHWEPERDAVPLNI
ncbi:hypothetical protein [Streptomyces sp. CB03238]|uniref:hypothetical protein n=1 Tax=Streptomyces sp. CB03238 TaxID=1907777 RepID=UPI000A1075E1|nr:hypothetical protein [Streptomyces sp. CB03238]ORT58125.1 hypothetical protein BKD26_19660 [Streptomyces sp. CB03238]